MVIGGYRQRAAAGTALSIDSAIAQFLDYHVRIEHRLASKTLRDYGRDFRQFAAFLAENRVHRVRAVVRDDVIRYLEHLTGGNVGHRTQARYLSSIRMVFAFLVSAGVLTDNPTIGLARPLFQTRSPITLEREEISKLLEAHDRNSPFGTRNAAMIALLYGTGLRISELLGLQASSVDFAAGVLRTGTGHKERVFLFSDETYLVVRTYVNRARERIMTRRGPEVAVLKKVAPLFVTREGGAMTTRTFARILAAAARRAGIRRTLSSHSLRHSFAAHLVEGGVDLRVIQAMLGHATIKSTEVYAHLCKR